MFWEIVAIVHVADGGGRCTLRHDLHVIFWLGTQRKALTDYNPISKTTKRHFALEIVLEIDITTHSRTKKLFATTKNNIARNS